MVIIVVVGTSPEWQKVMQGPWELIAGVSVDGLEESQRDPDQHSEHMQVLREINPENWHAHGPHAQQSDLDWMGIFGGDTEWSRISVVLLMNDLVEGAVMQSTVHPVVPGVFHHEENGNVFGNRGPMREWDTDLNTKVAANGVESPNGDSFNQKVRQKNSLEALPLLLEIGLLVVLNLVLSEVGDGVNDEPGQTSAKIQDLVENEDQQARGHNIICHV